MTERKGRKIATVVPIASAVREACVQLFPENPSLENLCTLTACAIVRIGRSRRIAVELVGGKYQKISFVGRPEFGNPAHIKASRQKAFEVPHAWVMDRNNYIDVTLTQFESDANPVSILPFDDPRFEGIPEPIELGEFLLRNGCGSSKAELRTVIAEARKILTRDREVCMREGR